MKKLLGLLLVAIMGFTACEGPMGPEGPPGKEGPSMEWWIKDYTITGEMWELVGGAGEIGSYYYYVIDNPDITRTIYDDGAIICYFRYKDDFGNDVQTPLPYTYYDIYVNESNVEFPYAVQFSYDAAPGSIALKLVFSDFYTGEYGPPASSKFRLVLLY
jgi:hypothetical protein